MERELYNLTNPQKSILLTEEFYNGSNINNICGTAIVESELNFDLLKQAINIVVKNNDSFNFKLVLDNNEMKQYIDRIDNIDVEIVDIDSKDDIAKIENEMMKHVFDIHNSRLFCFKIFRCKDNTGGFILNIHHLFADSWTLGLVAKQIVRIYSCLVNDEPIEKNDELSYINYIYSEKEYINSEKFLKDQEYWSDVFSTIPEQASIPGSKQGITNDFSPEANRQLFNIDKNLMNNINDFCRKINVSVFNFFMAVYSIYIGRVSNLDDFVIGTPILNRTNFKEKNTTGMFINTAPLRIKLNENLDFKSFVSSIAKDSLSMLRHQKYYYQNILEDLRKRDSSLPNLYNVLISYQVTKANTEKELSYNTRWAFNGCVSDDIDIHLYDLNDSGSIDIAYDYKVSKYRNADIVNVHMRILHIINQIINCENILLKDIEIVTEEERNQILNEFNNINHDYLTNESIIQLFEKQVKHTPNKVAISFYDKKLTYLELDNLVNKLANYLSDLNINKEDIIAIFMDKSLEMIIAILAILKVNACYLPIDIFYPESRINYMLKDSKAKLVLSSKSSPDLLKIDIKTINVDLNEDFYTNYSEVFNSTNETFPCDLAYIMYTSGSTGNPKGVMIEQKSIVRLVKNTNYINFKENDRILQTGSIVFDACTFEIWAALLNGLELHIIKKDDLLNISSFEKFINDNEITILWLTAPLFNQICEQNPNVFKGVRYLLTGGDVLSPKHINMVKLANPNLNIINGYGPTENTTFSCCFKIDSIYEHSIPIGKPISNSSCYVVSKFGTLQPIGIPGELWVGGHGVARGYLNNEQLTSKMFLNNLFGNSRIYKTGDLVKWLPDGNIEFIGRIDNQVKIRGFRVELNEINSKILKFENAKESITLISTNNNDKFICAYVVFKSGNTIVELKDFLKKCLPNYMIPSFIIPLDALPINTNGKVDKNMLPKIDEFIEVNNIIEPETSSEIKLADIWKSIFNIDTVGSNYNFFDIGGDSLLAIKLSSYIKSNFNIELSVSDIFKHPILKDLAKLIDSRSMNNKDYKISKFTKMNSYPLSSAQTRIYYATKMADADNILYNIPGGMLVNAVLDSKKIESAFKKLIKLHSSFRTCFKIIDDIPRQVVLDDVDFKVEIHNGSEVNIESIVNNFPKAFDLENAPLLRVCIYYLDNKKTLILMDSHHIIVDGTSLNILIRDFCKLYNDMDIENSNLEYVDYSVWENSYINSTEIVDKENYWVNSFKNHEIPVINLPYDYNVPATASYVGNKISMSIPNEVFAKFDAIAKEMQCSSYMVFLATFYVLLYKYTAQDSIIVGTPIANRDIDGLDNIIGMFVNNIALNANIDSTKTFRAFLEDIKSLVIDALTNQPYPYDLLAKKLNLNGKNLFDVMFTYQNTKKDELTIENSKLEIIESNTKTSKFNLSLEIIPDRSLINLEYRTDLFKDETAKRLLDHYINLLDYVGTHIDDKICDISMLSKEERNKVLYDFNNTKMDYPKDKTIIELFEEQVVKTPNSTAIVFEDKSLTYQELNDKANQLAWYLRNNNIGRNDIISIMMPRSLELLVSIIGTLKSGACYIPIDPNYPKDRTEYMLENSNSKLLLIGSSLCDSVDFANKIIVDLSNYNFEKNTSNLPKINESDDTSYIIYTSGSTGKPKGVVLKHQSLTNLAYYLNNYVDFLKDNSTAIASVTTVSFDIFIFETLIALQRGLKVVVANEEEQRLPSRLNILIKDNNIKAIQMTPSRMRMFLDSKEDCPYLSNLDYVVLAGEPLPDALRNDLLNIGVKKIYNGYGPSETTVFSTFTDVTDCDVVTIGHPLANTYMYILDKDLSPLPVGIPGELYIAGDGVGKGYLNNDTITKEKFIDNPFINNSIMYRTGDVCKFLDNGELTYVERIDNQVKIRGLRIELGEIENKLLEIPTIEKVKVVKQSIENRDFISAYYIATKEITANELRNFLSKSLPDYMIPAYFTALKEFPYTPNGKIDKNALPIPNVSLMSDKLEYVPPKNDTQIRLVNILEKILNVSHIGIQDNFFNLGGDSLTAILLCSNVKKVFNVDLSFKEVIDNPIIENLADIISHSKTYGGSYIKRYEKRDFYPASAAQKRTYLASNIENNSTLYNITGGILLDSLPNVDKLEKSLDLIIKRHEILRTYFEVIDGNIVQKIKENLDLKIYVEAVDTCDIDILFKRYQTIFDLSIAPLWNVHLLQLPNSKALLIFDTHHIIMDGTSLNNLVQEISDAYNNINLPELPIDYKDFALWEEKQLSENGFKESKDFWLEKFNDDVPILNMPTTYSRPANKSYEGNTIFTSIAEDLTKKIYDFSNEYQVTPYMFMLACYYVLLYKYTNQEDIVVGSPVSGRPYAELEHLLGMFVNSLPLRNTISSDLDFEKFLMNIKKSCVDAFSHQDYPFDVLVSDLNIVRDNSRSPLFDTMFIYQNNGFKMFEFDNINAYYQIPTSTTSKFDISLEVIPQNDTFKLSFEYCTKLFDEDFINNFATHYLNILRTVLEKPEQKVSDISILSKDEMSRILYDFNNTKMDYPKDKTIATLFEEQVEKTPNHVAVVFEDKMLTYRELNEKANQLAWFLKNNGIGNGSIVGIMLPRSLEILVAMVGVLKTGACYIPIDPTLPINRIIYMLSNSNANMILTLSDIVSSDITIKNINIKLDNNSIYCGNSNNLNINVDQNAPSYTIYTSGSTGTPKGVVLNHKALVNLATYLNNNVEFLKDEYLNMAIASITTISFDIFIFETLICLQRGLKIIIANEAEQNTPNLLDKLIEKNDVKAIQMTPSRMHIFVNNKNIMPHLSNLKYVVLAGEALPKDLLDSILELGKITVYNGYGPSETTVFSTFTDVTHQEHITIGKPLANTRIYILDKDMNPVSIGNPGEMYISGDGVGIGYANNEEITKERFITDIFYPNEKMYRTGDLAKHLPNGEIHYIGRVDHQIKIRGLRIELDEIENCILKYPNIDKCIIMADTDNNNRQYIVAYLSVTDRISVNKLRMFLKTYLPKYMVPSYFVILDKIPYLNNGKINKKALPKPEINSSSATAEYVAPRNKIELQIATIFQSLLSIYPIGINDNFFELGGDSLLAINLQVELLKLNFNITYSDIFMYPTIKDLAKKVVSNEVTTFNDINASDFTEFSKILDKNCILPNKIESKDIGNVIITGTTGFLGAHVLDAFLKNEHGIAYCFVRPEAGLTLENKFMKKLHFYFGNKYDSLIGSRIIIVNADISLDNLGLSEEKVIALAKDVSCIINCAAKVSHFGNYNNYKQINVTGTENLLKFCMKFDKRFYQISTLSVSGNSLVDQSYIEQSFEEDITFRENDFYIHQNLDNVYVRSKFEAEKLVFQYILNGLDGYICRVGNLMNRNSDGKFQPNVDENAYIGRLLSLANIGCIPDYLLNGYMEFTPIDSCAEAIIKLAEHPTSTNRIFHLYDRNHVDVKDFISIFEKYIPFEVVSNEEFISKINNIFKREDSNKILSGILRDFDANEKLVYESKVKLNCDFTVKYLSKIGFEWPKIDKNYIKKFLDYYCLLGYITKEEKL